MFYIGIGGVGSLERDTIIRTCTLSYLIESTLLFKKPHTSVIFIKIKDLFYGCPTLQL